MKPLISLVIPVYNVEKYLPRCMDSVLAQTYENFEVVLVDDGSTDRSGRMCDEYAANDRRVRTLHKENGGLSDARNYGVQRANGGLISFIDSDDYVTEDYLEYLYCLMEKYGADITGNRRMLVNEGERPKHVSRTQEIEYCLDTANAMKEICYGSVIGVSACVKLFKRELLLNAPYPVGKYYEDLAATYRQFAGATRVAMGTRITYFYVQRNGSIRHSALDEQKLYGLVAATEQLQYISQNFPEAERAAHVRCATMAVDYIQQVLSDKDTGRFYFKKIQEYIRPHMKAVLMDRVKNIGFKFRCMVVMMGYWPTRLLWKPGERIRMIVYGDRRLRAAADLAEKARDNRGGLKLLSDSHSYSGRIPLCGGICA